MPCYKCANGNYKYGKKGKCQFDTLKKCKEAEQAIHAKKKKPCKKKKPAKKASEQQQ